MAGRRDGGPRGDLARLAGEFAQWRRTHACGTRIPGRLWDSAAELVLQHGLSRTATALKLGYYDLKKRVAEKSSTTGPSSAFVELSPSLSVPSECTIELEKRDGSRMRIEVTGVSVPDLGALTRSFWEAT